MLFPVTVELPPEQSERLAKQQEMLYSLGLQVEHFGEESWVIKAVPAMLNGLAPVDILEDSLKSLEGVQQRNSAESVPAAVDDLLSSLVQAALGLVSAAHVDSVLAGNLYHLGGLHDELLFALQLQRQAL